MPTLNLGRVGFVNKGAWSIATAYKINDVVTYNNGTYASLQAHTGQAPIAGGSAYWQEWITSDNSTFVANAINAATTQATPLDANEFGYVSETSPGVFELVKMAGADIKAWLLSYFDTLYSRTTAIFGIGQTWQDVTASRTNGVVYTNDTGKMIKVSCRFEIGASSAFALQIDPSGTPLNVDSYYNNTTLGPIGVTFQCEVPNGMTYRALISLGTATKTTWLELR